MAKELGNQLPEVVRERLNGEDLALEMGVGYVLVTADADGTPRVSMQSAGEILAYDQRTIRYGLWPGTNTGGNIGSGRPVVLCFVIPETVLYITGRGRRLESDNSIEVFEVAVESVKSDAHPGLPVQSSITFACVGMSEQEVLDMWHRQQQKLREAA